LTAALMPISKRLALIKLVVVAACVLAVTTVSAATWPTSGGDQGRTITVTTLADSGEGSLRAALETAGPRRITFAVAGEIWLKSPLVVRHPFVTVDGETAPAPGITLIGDHGIRTRSHDIILRHLRIRVGALPTAADPQNRDGISIDGSLDGKDPTYNVMVENCSIAWSIDELLQVWGGNSSNIRIRNSILAEALQKSIHPKGAHSMGLVVGPGTRNVVVEANLFAHNSGRNPVVAGGARALVVNNVIYNPGFAAVHFYPDKRVGPTLASIIGNVVIAGKNTKRRLAAFSLGINEGSQVYYRDNISEGTQTFDKEERAGRLQTGESPVVETAPVAIEGIPEMPSGKVLEHVLATAGARPDARDATDKRIVSEVKNRTGTLKDAPPDDRLTATAAAPAQ
jgi:hypothetical protein